MRKIMNFCAAAAALCLVAAPAFAAAPDALDAAPPAPKAGLATISGADPYRLDTEMTVHNWVLCISADRAERLVKARGESREKGIAVYGDLKSAKACGMFPEMRVILQQPVYEPAATSSDDGHVFDALVRVSGQWAKAFVVSADE
jgi:hypothetical protein